MRKRWGGEYRVVVFNDGRSIVESKRYDPMLSIYWKKIREAKNEEDATMLADKIYACCFSNQVRKTMY